MERINLLCRWACALVLCILLSSNAIADEGNADSSNTRGTDDRSLTQGADAPRSPTNPSPLRRPVETPPEPEPTPLADFIETPNPPPLGFAGSSHIWPRDVPDGNDFIPVEDRWRIGFPEWDRYGKGHPRLDDYPYVTVRWWNPYTQNVLKGDYAILGQDKFLNLTASTTAIFEPRNLPTATTPFESTTRPNREEFFGSPNQFFYTQYVAISADFFQGDASFKPPDWRVKLTPIFNVNYLAVDELGIVSPDVRDGTTRGRTFISLEEYFAEYKLADLSLEYDFISVRVGSQPFVSDFKGFIFIDTNRAVRLFGNLNANQDQYNLVYFRPAEKDTNSLLNTMNDRDQDVVIANWYHQDFIWPGYTAQASFHYNHDNGGFKFNKDNFLVRPDPVGVFKQHEVNAFYLGWAGDGHIDRFNISHAFYWVFGRDTNNPLANCPQDIRAQMAALELSYDRDWARFRISFLWASGDDNINNAHASGFDTIMDNPNFAGGNFSYWQRQAIPLFGINLVQRESLFPDMRSSKFQGQSNFVNPGLLLGNLGLDLDLTPKLKMINNVNLLWFNQTEVLEQFVFQAHIHHFIGADISSGIEYRPLLNNNVIFVFGVAMLFPGDGFHDLYNRLDHTVPPLGQAFLETILTY